MPQQEQNPKQFHEQNFADGVNMDLDENKMPNTAAYFLKNAINGINNGQGLNQEGFSEESLTKLVANWTDFPIQNILPFYRNYTINLSSLTYPITAFSHVIDWVETKDNVVLHTAFDTNAYMTGLGWTQGFGQTFTISNAPQWQRFNFLTNTNAFVEVDSVFVSNGQQWGSNQCCGFKYDVKLNQYFVFNWNSANRHSIWLYDANLNTYQLVIEAPILNFNLAHRITAINVVLLPILNNGVETIERLLYWTDNYNQPRKINIDHCNKNNQGYYLTAPMNYVSSDEFMRLIKFAPYPYPSFDATQAPDSSVTQNFIQRSLLQFMIRHICDDKEQTVYSSISSLFVPNIQENTTGLPNFVLLENLDAGSEIVTNIEIAYRTSNIDQWLTYITIPRSEVLSQSQYSYNAIANQFQYKFFNNRQSIPIDTAVSSKNFDEVPQLAGAQEFITTNMLALTNGVNGYANLDEIQIAKVSVTPEYSNPLLTVAFSSYVYLPTGSVANVTFGLIRNRGGQETILASVQVAILNPNPPGYPVNLNYTTADYQKGDQLYIRVLALSASVSLSGFALSGFNTIFMGSYSVGLGSWNVYNAASQALNLNDRIIFNTVTSDPQHTFTLNNVSTPNTTNYDTLYNNGLFQHLKNGGQYKFGIVLKDDAGRSGFVQTNDSSLLVSIDNIQDGNVGIKDTTLAVSYYGLVVPDWVKTISLVRTQNLAIHNGAFGQSFLQWEIGSLLFFEPDGTSHASPTGFNITYIQFQLLELATFNSNNLLNTTTTYTWAAGDRVKFIAYADGTGNLTYYTTVVDAQIKSVDSVTYSCPYNTTLSTLTNLSTVEVYTPEYTSGTEIFYEIGQSVECTGVAGNNQPVTTLFYIKTFDSYVITRTLPQQNYSNTYESPSAYDTALVPSNGEDIGRANVVNPFAQQVRDYSLIQYSNAFNPDSQINGLSTFDDGDSKLYFQGNGAINKLYCDGDYNMIAIQDSKAFRILIGKKLLTDNAGGQVVAVTDEILSDPIQINGNYGCQNPETFVVTQNGLMLWTDLKRGREVICDWKTASDRGEWGYDAYAMSKLKYIANSNNQSNPTIYLQSGYDPLNDMALTTSFQIQQGFINSASTTDITLNETWGSYVNRKRFGGHFSFTPEWYGICEGHQLGNMMITFNQGLPYYHNGATQYNFNTFYGVPCRQYVGIIAHDVLVRNNLEIESYLIARKTKNWLNIGLDTRDNNLPQSAVMYELIYATTNLGQLTNTPLAASKFREGIQWMPIYKDTMGGGTIFSGRTMKGTYLKALFMDNASAQNVYNRLNKIIITFNFSQQTF